MFGNRFVTSSLQRAASAGSGKAFQAAYRLQNRWGSQPSGIISLNGGKGGVRFASSSRSNRSGRTHSGISWMVWEPKDGAEELVPLLMIHGFACSAAEWGALPRMLANATSRKIVVFDHRGLGDSCGCEGSSNTIRLLADDAYEVVREAVEEDSIHVLGISMGGMIAQDMVLSAMEDGSTSTERPSILSLLLGCTTHGGRESFPPPIEFFKLCKTWSNGNVENRDEQLEYSRSFVDFCLPPNFAGENAGKKKLFDKFTHQFLATRRTNAGLQNQLSALSKFNSIPQLPSLETPALILHGTEDGVMPIDNARSLASKLQKGRLLEIQGAGHFWWMQKSSEVEKQIDDFLREND